MARKKDSTGICFIGEHDFREFLSRWIAARRVPLHRVDAFPRLDGV